MKELTLNEKTRIFLVALTKENMMNFGFSQVHYLSSKKRETLSREGGDLQLKLTKQKPNIHGHLSCLIKNNSRIKGTFTV